MFFIKNFMALHTQSNPVRQISFIKATNISPMYSSSTQFGFSTMFTGRWCTFPFTHPFMQGPITNFITQPIPTLASIKFFKEFTLTLFATSNSYFINTWNNFKTIITNITFFDYSVSLRNSPTFKRTKNTSIRSSFERICTDFTIFINHHKFILT